MNGKIKLGYVVYFNKILNKSKKKLFKKSQIIIRYKLYNLISNLNIYLHIIFLIKLN